MTGPPSGVHRRARPLKAVPIEALTAAARTVGGVRRRDLVSGDRVIVSTRNSLYSLVARSDGRFEVSGGWFEREGRGPSTVEILGCTAGGHALFTDLIAAPGFFIEFAESLRTTRVRTVRTITGEGPPQ